MSFIYLDLRDRERTCIKEKVKSRSKFTCSEILYNPAEMTDQQQKIWQEKYCGKIWEIEDEGLDFKIKWKILERTQSFSPISGACGLCTLEKGYILFKSDETSLNKRGKIAGHSFHKEPALLVKYPNYSNFLMLILVVFQSLKMQSVFTPILKQFLTIDDKGLTFSVNYSRNQLRTCAHHILTITRNHLTSWILAVHNSSQY